VVHSGKSLIQGRNSMILWSAKWCGPCKMLKPWLEANYPEVEIKDVDVEKPPKEIRSVPTLQDGNDFYTGVPTIKEHLERNNDGKQDTEAR